MSGVSIDVQLSGEAIEFLKDKRRSLEDRHELNARLAVRVKREVFDNFTRKAAQPNKNNWKPTGFFEAFARRTQIGSVTADSAQVVIGDPDHSLARKLSQNPGPITPKEAKYLAIPARSEAYGKTPRSFTDLFPIIFKSGAGALVQREQTRVNFGRKRKDGSRSVTPGQQLGGLVFYWLVKSANPPPDPDALPSTDKLQVAANEEADVFFQSFFSR